MMETIKKSVDIHAPTNIVWQILTEDQFTRQWYSEFSEGTFATTDWKEGSKVIFADESRSGLIGKIITNKPNNLLAVEYTGNFIDGKEDYESDTAKAVMGGREIYQLTAVNDLTRLSIECDLVESLIPTMSQAWDKALQLIKRLAEKNTVPHYQQ